MLATTGELPVGPGWAYEFKWDGVRALAVISPDKIKLYARSGADITRGYPELLGLGRALAENGITEAVLDGEIVSLDADGRPSFMALSERMHVRDPARTRTLAQTRPVNYLVFDILEANGTDISGIAYVERRQLLESVLPRLGDPGRWSVPPSFTDGPATLDAAASLALEGVVAKRLVSTYRPGLRSPDWVKIKHERTGDYVIGAWRPGRRALGAVLVGTHTPHGLVYRGRVGGGISAAVEKDLLARMGPLRTPGSPFTTIIPREDAKDATWVRPELVVEVRYGNVTPDGRLRFPRFVRLRPDKRPEETADA
jgi:bifunctional non-homologous end joining protein LigD